MVRSRSCAVDAAKVMHASPFRATVKLDSRTDLSSEEEPFEREFTKPSPIKDDCEVLRSERDQFLNTF